MKPVLPVIALPTLFTGCSAQAPAPQAQVRDNLARPVDCSTAAADIQTLTSEKARTSQEIGTGEYNRKLDAKIAEIRSQCGMK